MADLARYRAPQRLLRLALAHRDSVRDGFAFLLGRPFPRDRHALLDLGVPERKDSPSGSYAWGSVSTKSDALEREDLSERETVSSIGAWKERLPPSCIPPCSPAD